MVDTFVTNAPPVEDQWKLHSDFNYFFNPFEDLGTTGKITWSDVDDQDNSAGADADSLEDNIFGYNFQPVPRRNVTRRDEEVWKAMAHNGILSLAAGDGLALDDHNIHGLHVASIAAAKDANIPNSVVGVAHECMIYPIRIEVAAGPGELIDPTSHILSILEGASKCDVINMSWGFFDDPGPELQAAVMTAADPNGFDCVLVASVGNLSNNPGVSDPLVAWPARYAEVVGTGNMAKDLTLFFDSQFGPEVGFVSVVAPTDHGVPVNTQVQCSVCCAGPGETVDGDCPKTEGFKANFNGTSASSPHVAGIAALIRSRFPTLNNIEVRDRIIRSAQWYWTNTHQDTLKFGNGKVNAYRALTEWGNITSNTTWDPSDTRDGAFYISGDLTIDEGVTLTINPGTVVRVAPDHEELGNDTTRVEIVVKGTLIVGSSSSNPVVFESFTDSAPTTQDWVGIVFDTTSTGSVLDNVIIQNAQIGVKNFAAATLMNCEISNCVEGIVANADLTIENSTIHDNTSFGVEVSAGFVSLETDTIFNCSQGVDVGSSGGAFASVTISDSYIHDIDFNGVVAISASDTVVIVRTRIENMDQGAVFISSAKGTVDSCTVKNTINGVFILASPAVSVKSSLIDSNTTNGIYCALTASNLLTWNTITNSPVGIFCSTSSVVIKNGNTIQNNTTGIKCDANSSPLVEWNTITGNQVGVFAVNSSNPDIGNGAGGSIGNNTITLNTTHHVANLSPSITVMAESNWWGSANGPHPTKFSGLVDYTPWDTLAPGGPPLPSSPFMKQDEPKDDGNLPSTFALASNYPNPFNPVTTIKYEVPPPGGRVSVVIYNVRGQRVRTLVSADNVPGFHTLKWKGTNDNGEPVSSGVYFVQMRAKGFVETKKLVLLK